jgi:ubiquinone/menaquinone biosynthesis C-methylase UbiE
VTPRPTTDAVRREYAALAERYDRRWATYVERSLTLLRPWVEGAALGRVLDVGCGTAALLPRLRAWSANFSAYAGLDMAPEMLLAARAKSAGAPHSAAFVVGDAGALPFRAASFDTVVSASSLHYWDEAEAVFAEIRRVLRPGGRLLLLDWSRDSLVMKIADAAMRLGGVEYVRTYACAEVAALLDRAGFRVTREARGSAGSFWRVLAFDAVSS